MVRQRLDNLMVERGLVESRTRAQALIMAGQVIVSGMAAVKPGTPVTAEAVIDMLEPPPFVGRGGIKLDYALDHFRLDVSDRAVADIGASTGGFTDCLLKRGAGRVYAVDVGHGQLDYRLRRDTRVVVMEGVNARYPFHLPEKVALATMDLSFISVEKVIPSVVALLEDNAYLVVLIKPQFEARRNEVGKGGVIKDMLLHAVVLGRFITWAVNHGLRLKGLITSPLPGASGNREFFVLLKST